METIFTGTVHKYGDDINTDIISPPATLELTIEEAAPYTMSPIDPDFATKFHPGDILVAGNNFGSGSSRETAPLCLKALGVTVIIAKSFARIFYRNAINLGILAIECPDTDKITDGSELQVDFINGTVRNLTTSEEYRSTKMPEHILALVNAGGLIPYLKQTMHA